MQQTLESFFGEKNFLNLTVFSFESTKQRQEVIKTKPPFADKEIEVPVSLQETYTLTETHATF